MLTNFNKNVKEYNNYKINYNHIKITIITINIFPLNNVHILSNQNKMPHKLTALMQTTSIALFHNITLV
jgi:hypothetical protein